MRFVTTVLLGAIPIAFAQYSGYLVSCIGQIQQQIEALDYTVAGFDGAPLTGVGDILGIQTQADSLGRTIQSCTYTAYYTPLLNSQDSEAVSAAILQVRPIVEDLLTRLQFLRPKFDSAFFGVFSVSKQIQQVLTDQKALAVAFAHEVTKKLSGAYREKAPELTDEFKDAFDVAIAEYAVADGIQLPGIPIPPFVPKKV
ncbi:hypothetical protein CKM354_001246800 [Cercospora kikuchii]|uniref:Cell wall galactomannoprotein n=1 Tax=Cercospora kikuchii TaxID=84275 RepID=A0A9P3L1W9_9PEZI|nr:uncharacterized protein CKM354_001246800 [Cercospora kikuchii]GIZ49438.1 hypothetical protein CKM354_001246800 [Cercospora kikuchii]